MLNLSLEIEYAINKLTDFLLLLSLSVLVSCNSSELKSSTQVTNTPVTQTNSAREIKSSLAELALKLTKLYENGNCKEFFNAFPNNFRDFDELYGFDDETGERILYSKYPEHMNFFFSCSEVSDREKLKKVIEIGINGKWEADASSMLQEGAFKLIKSHPDEARKILDSLPDEKAASFWYFLFDRPHPSDKEIKKEVKLLIKLLGRNSKQSKLLSEQYKKLLADWSEE